MNKLTEQIQAEVNKVVLGKEDIVRKVLLAILAQGHVLLEDVPGVGKTTLAKAFSKTLGLIPDASSSPLIRCPLILSAFPYLTRRTAS